jgi:hypothetical protein
MWGGVLDGYYWLVGYVFCLFVFFVVEFVWFSLFGEGVWVLGVGVVGYSYGGFRGVMWCCVGEK